MADSPFLAREFQTGDGALPYRLLPNPTDEPQPLVLFLHGAGERGTDNEAQLVHVVGMFTKPEAREQFPCQVIAPQCPPGKSWVDCDWSASRHELPEAPSGPQGLVLALLEQCIADPMVDASRVYMMGLSMGGYGTWDLVARRSELFAAAVPICGGGDENVADRLAQVPIWVFHGADDSVVPVARSRNMVDAVRAAGGSIRYTEYAGTGHNSWGPASREPGLLPWFFAQGLSRQDADEAIRPSPGCPWRNSV